MKQLEFKTKLNKTKKQKNAEIGGYTKDHPSRLQSYDELSFMQFFKIGWKC